jgi:hypothetical protein
MLTKSKILTKLQEVNFYTALRGGLEAFVKEIAAFFDLIKRTYGERVEIVPANGNDLDKAPEKLKALYSYLSKADLPFGSIYSIEIAVKDSKAPPFPPDWFNFGQTHYFSYWLCSYSADDKGMSFLSWDHETGNAPLNACKNDIISFLESEYKKYKESKKANPLVDIMLVELPDGGAEGLYELLNDLGLDVSQNLVSEYQNAELPVLIGENELWCDVRPMLDELDDDSVIDIIFKD